MTEVKFLHCADIHLDAPFSSLESSTDKSSIRRQDLKETFKKIINLAKSESVDLLLISGDLYEHNYVKKSTINYINDLFNDIPDTKVIIIPGNHDPYIPNSFYKNHTWSKNVFILTDERPAVMFEELKVRISGIGFKNFFEEGAIKHNIKCAEEGYINILLVHGTIDMNLGKCLYNPLSSGDLKALNMDYTALGHFHNRMEDVGGQGTLFNPGSPEPLGFDETGEHGVYIGSISKDMTESKLQVRFINLNKRFYENIDVNVNGCFTDEQVISRMGKALKDSEARSKTGLYCISLKGYIESSFKIDVNVLQMFFTDKVFYMKIKDETTADYNFEEIAKEPGLRGLFARKLILRIKATGDEQEKRILMNALYYGIEALEQGKVEVS